MAKSKISDKKDYLDPNKLIEDYSPLIKSIYRKFSKFNNLFHTAQDYEDLESQVQYEFLRLCSEYNPARGVDFPGFIKFHLQQRVYHHVTKLQRTRQKETVSYTKYHDGEQEDSVDFDNCIESTPDDNTPSEFERVEALSCLDWSVIQSKKQKWLIEAVLFEHKSLEEIARDEGVPLKVIRLRLYAVCNILIEHANELDEIQRNKLSQLRQYTMDSSDEDFNIVRKPIITRTPIYMED